ncbi:MAG TPA: hypothetical protein VFM18_19200 [Methanosarcina sp.]|nr:hypothetical protein [Methanosarcina sp.]
MALTNVTLTTAAANIFLNATSGNTAISTIHLCNFTGFTQIANLYAVPIGKTAGTSTIIYSNVNISPNNTLIVSAEQIILSSVGDAIMANCGNANAITATVSTRGV